VFIDGQLQYSIILTCFARWFQFFASISLSYCVCVCVRARVHVRVCVCVWGGFPAQEMACEEIFSMG